MKFPKNIQRLIDEFSLFPTVGPKTAERYVFYLLKRSGNDIQKLVDALLELKKNSIVCRSCHSLSESDPCPICTDPKRSQETICIVADTRDMLTIEGIGQYNGLYHVLGGELNPIEGIKPEQLTIKQLPARISSLSAKEVILALNPTIEGETTSLYIAKLLKPLGIKITRIAKGLPMGADIEYADDITLTNALKYRNEM